jgi:hypothetical protein
MFRRLAQTQPTPIEPLPGWYARRERNVEPAQAILARIPSGPVLDDSEANAVRARPSHGDRRPSRAVRHSA